MLQNTTSVNMGKKSSCKRFKAFVTVLSQNMRGLKTAESITELIDVLEQRRAFACCGQETWRQGFER